MSTITLTKDDLIAVCVGFAEAMGFTDSFGGSEWTSRMEGAGGPAALVTELESAVEEGLASLKHGPENFGGWVPVARTGKWLPEEMV